MLFCLSQVKPSLLVIDKLDHIAWPWEEIQQISLLWFSYLFFICHETQLKNANPNSMLVK